MKLIKRLDRTSSFHISSKNSNCIFKSFDVVGKIAIIRLRYCSMTKAQIFAKALMSRNRNIKTVLLQASPVMGDLRLRSLVYIGGENTTRTIHKEFGCLFSVDLAKCYFSPRLSYERMRIAKMIEPKEIILNMFAGVGCFSIILAKHAKPCKVFSIDINKTAFKFMKENIRLNRVYDKVLPILGDSREITCNQLQGSADRVLMPLPEKALQYLPYAILALRKSGGWIHCYGFEHVSKTKRFVESIKLKTAKIIESKKMNFDVPFARIVRSVGPNWLQLVADLHVFSN